MARQYRPYRAKKPGNNRLMYIIIGVVAVAAVAALIFFLNRGTSDEDSLAEVLPENKTLPVTEPAVRPKPDESLMRPRATLDLNPPESKPAQTESSTPTAAPSPSVPPVSQAPAETTSAPTPSPVTTPPAAAATTMTPTAASTVSSSKDAMIIIEAEKDIEKGNIIAARDKLNQVLAYGSLSERDRGQVKQILARLADRWLFSDKVYPNDTLTVEYKVKPGDLLALIGRDHKVPYQALMRINNIPDARLLQAGKTIKVINGPFHTIVDKGRFEMDLYLGKDTYVKTYRIGIGQEGRETPLGKWIVKPGGKLIEPTWTDPDTGKTYLADSPDYPLGSRWISIDGIEGPAKGRTGFAIHGTKDPDSIGQRSSRGCIRLFNGDVIEVFNLLSEGHSEVRVVDSGETYNVEK